MHPRQRSPRGFYASDYRHINRDAGFVRGHLNPKSFSQPPHPPPPPPLPPSSSRRGGGGGTGGDVFVEAGRLAAEYLVSQGVLPPNVLSLKWHNHGVGVGGFKKQGEIPVEGGGRTSALARLGSTVDGMSGRRKSGFDEFGQKGRRRGSFRINGLDWGREFRRSGSWSDRCRGNLDIKDDGDDDSVTRQQDEEQQQQQVGVGVDVGVGGGGGGDGGGGVDDVGVGVGGGGVDDVLQKPNSNEVVPRSEDGNDLDAEADKDRVSGELLDLKENSSGEEKDTYNMEMGFVKSSNDLENVSDEVKEVKDGACHDDDDDDIEKSSISKNLSVQSSDQEDNSSSRVVTDLLSLCKSVKVPTKTRTSRTNKNLKADHHRNYGEENIQDIESLQGPEVLADNESVKEPSSGDMLSEKTYDLEHIDSDIAKVEPVLAAENTKELDTACNVEEVQTIGSQSGQDRGYMHDNSQESSVTLPEYGSCSSMAGERGEKRVAEDDDIREDTKRLREWIPALVPRTEEYFLHNNRIGMKESLGEDEISPIDKVTMTSDQESLMSSSQFTQGGDKPFLQGSEEKQSLPSSFRTCDLNLIEASEVHENHVDHPILIYPPVTKTKKSVPVDIDLSMSHASASGKFTAHTTSGKEIEVIDLENDSIQEEKSVDNMERKYCFFFPYFFSCFMLVLFNVFYPIPRLLCLLGPN